MPDRMLRFSVWLLLVVAGTFRAMAAEPEPHRNPRDAKRLALLVGCAQYDHLPTLRLKGPTNDVIEFNKLLVDRGFAAEDVRILADGVSSAVGRPTRAAIEAEFRSLAERAGLGVSVVVLLSGHGSQQPNIPDPQHPDPDDADGWDEVFLPVDVTHWNGDAKAVPNALVDDDLFLLCKSIIDKGAFLWLIMDSCHSGQSLRGDTGETVREVSVATLGIDEAEVRRANASISQAAPQVAPQAFELEQPLKNLVACYACQDRESTVERPMPYAGQAVANPAEHTPRREHGIFTYAICKTLRESKGQERSYRDLVAAVWTMYRAWGRTEPSPGIEGADADRAIFGVARPTRRYELELLAPGEWRIDAGDLDGINLGCVLAVYPPDEESPAPLGHLIARDVSAGNSLLRGLNKDDLARLPASVGRIALPTELPPRCYARVAYQDYGDLRVTVAIDLRQPDLQPADRARLEAIQTELLRRQDVPGAIFRVQTGFSPSAWMLQVRNGVLTLVNGGAVIDLTSEALPPETVRFVLNNEQPVDDLLEKLTQIFRGQNLVRLSEPAANKSADETRREHVQIDVQTMRYRDANDRTGEPLRWSRNLPDVRAGDRVGWTITNLSSFDVDVTVLYVDAEFQILSVYPTLNAIAINNRLASRPPNNMIRTKPVVITDVPLGVERVIVIAVRGSGLLKDYRFLAAPSYAAARGIEGRIRGAEDNVMDSPLGQLLSQASFRDAQQGTTRGAPLPVDDGAKPINGAIVSFSWLTRK